MRYVFRTLNVVTMVVVAQLVERWIVAPVVVGSSPIDHPILLQGGGKCCLIPRLEKRHDVFHLDVSGR